MNTNETKVRFSYDGNKTTVTLISRTTNEEITNRFVRVREGDFFDKKTGRSAAFKKAMTHVAATNLLSKGERTNLWTNFRTIVKQPK
jgi:hypothetical protein